MSDTDHLLPLPCDMSTEEINAVLKDQWYPYHKGRCYIFSKGAACRCHFCLIDELTDRAKKNEITS